jgi:hypothetical protein
MDCGSMAVDKGKSQIPRAKRTGCLQWYIGLAIAAGLILIPTNLIDFAMGEQIHAPLWYKFANILLLLVHTLSMIMIWRGRRWGAIGYVIATMAYWIANTQYRGFTIGSLLISLGMTALFLALVYRDQKAMNHEVIVAE